MNSSKWKQFVADGGLEATSCWCSLVIGSYVGAAFAVTEIEPNREDFRDWRFNVAFLVAMLASTVLGLFFTFFFIGVAIRYVVLVKQGESNGAPYEKGEKVRILTKAHRDKAAVVLAYYNEETFRGPSLQVELGQEKLFLKSWKVTCEEKPRRKHVA